MTMKRNKTQVFLRELAQEFYWSQVFAMLCLMGLSVLFVYSATSLGGDGIPARVRGQGIWFAIGLACYVVVALMDYHWLCRKSWLIYSGVLFMLVWVLVWGRAIYGARRWISLPHSSIQIQPSEFAKVSVLLLLCYYLSRCIGGLRNWRQIGLATALALVPGVLIHKQPDLGTALVVISLFLMLMFLGGAPMRFFGLLGVVAMLGMALVGLDTYRYREFRKEKTEEAAVTGQKFKSYLHLKEYQLNRILGVVAPDELDRLAEGWNGLQSRIAIGSGGFNGKGWTKGDVTRGGYLPRTVSLNDFIFAVFAEETGFVGGTVLVILYAILLLGGIRITMKARDNLGMLLAAGVTFLLFFHVFVNMGMALGILPIVGVPLPLMSYGGSFVLVCMISLGLLQSVWLHRKHY